MKKGRILSVLLVLCIMVLSLPVSVSAAAGEYYVEKDTFNYEDQSELEANGWTSGFARYGLGDDIKGFEGSKSLCLSAPPTVGTKACYAEKAFSEIRTNEKYNISFDIKIDNTSAYTSADSWANINFLLFSGSSSMSFVKFNFHNKKIDSLGDLNKGSFDWNTPYHVEIEGDNRADQYYTYVTVTDENDEIIANKVARYQSWSGSSDIITTFDKVRFFLNIDGTSVASTNDTKVYIDNFKLEYPASSTESKIGVSQDYEWLRVDGNHLGDFDKQLIPYGWTFPAANYLYAVNNGYEDTKGLKFTYNTKKDSWYGTWGCLSLDGLQNSTFLADKGYVNTNFKLKIEPPAEADLGKFVIGIGKEAGKYRRMISFNENGKIGIGQESTDTDWTYGTNKWYDVDIMYNIETRNVEYKITDVLNPSVVIQDETTLAEHENLSDIGKVLFVAYASEYLDGPKNDGGAIIDNLEVKYISPQPELINGSLRVYNVSGAVQEDLLRISAATNRITFDLGTNIDIDTVDDSTLYLKNVTDNKYVQYKYSSDGTVVTMTLNKMLEAGKEYQLVLTGDVMNTSGLAATPFSIDMKTLDAELKAECGDVKVGGTILGNISQIAAGSAISVDVTMLNTTNKEQNPCVIFSYFSNNKLIGATIDKETLALGAADMNGSATVSATVPEFAAGETVDAVKIFVWSGIDTLKAMGDCYSFPAAE